MSTFRINQRGDVDDAFPPPSIACTSPEIRPILSWAQLHEERKVTGIEFDLFWYEAVIGGDCYFYSWLSEPRATVLVVFDDERLKHVECRKSGDVELSADEAAPIVAQLVRAFEAEGYRVKPDSQPL